MPPVSETMQVSGVRCERCVMRLGGALRRLEGIEAANANLLGELSLTWDDQRLDRETIVEALARAGFEVGGIRGVATRAKPELATVAPDPPEASLADRHAMAFASTCVVAGRADGIVVATGAASEVGVIARGLEGDERRRSVLQRELDRLVRILLAVAIGLVGITFGYKDSGGVRLIYAYDMGRVRAELSSLQKVAK